MQNGLQNMAHAILGIGIWKVATQLADETLFPLTLKRS